MYRGLSNLGNTCYINSTIQCLYYLKPFSNFLLKRKKILNYGITEKFIKVLEYLNGAPTKPYFENDLKDFVKSFLLSNTMFKKNEQNDCHIFLVSLLGVMNKDLLTYSQSDEISKLFYNNISTRTSNNYGENIDEEEHSFCISLPIKNNKTRFSSLDECIKNFQTAKKIVDSYTNKIYIEETKIIPCGKFLVFNLQRLSEGRHVSHLVSYPQFLILENYNYELIGIIKHIGNEFGGHKVAICKDFNTWIQFDDDVPTILGNNLPQEDLAFLLFYQKIDDNKSRYVGKTEKIIYNSGTSILDQYKIYEMKQREKEKKIFSFMERIYRQKGFLNENDFLKIHAQKNMQIEIFEKKFNIKDIPEDFIEDYEIDYFKLINAYKKMILKK